MGIFRSPVTPVDELSFTVVDVETTGLDPSTGDRICEIALLRVAPAGEVARLESLVQPFHPMTPGASAINGITDTMLVGAPPFATVLPRVQELLQDTVLVAHNASFDLSFLRQEFRAAGYGLPTLAVVDTLVIAQARYRFAHNSLQAIAEGLGISTLIRHRAMADVLTTWQVLQRFLEDFRRQGPVTLAHLMYPAARQSVAALAGITITLHEALRTGKLLHLRYQGARNGAQTHRVVQPLEMCYERGHSYLRAFCHLRQGERNFRLDRIVELRPFTEDYASDCSPG